MNHTNTWTASRADVAQLRIDAVGVYCRAWSDTVIPWSNIERIQAGNYTVQYRGQRYCSLILRDPALNPSSRRLGKLTVVNGMIGLGDVLLSIEGTDQNWASLIEALSVYHRAGVEDRGENWCTLISTVLVALCQLLR